MRIAVLGAGAMGSLFGGRLAAAGEDVTLLTRNAEHVAAIQSDGLRVVDATADDPTGDDHIDPIPVAAATDPATVGAVDLVIVFVKSGATAQAMTEAGPLLDSETAVLTLQNGLGNAETIAEFVDTDRVFAGVTTHGAIHEAPGRVRHTGRGDTALGPWSEATERDAAEEIAARLTAAGIPTDAVGDPETLLWEKVLVNVGINAPTALAGVENGALARTEPGRQLLAAAVTEAAAVARACGHDVRSDIVEYALSVAERTANNHSSMRVDLEAGSPTEVESLYGAVVDRAGAVDVSVPVVRTLAALIRLAQTDARENRE